MSLKKLTVVKGDLAVQGSSNVTQYQIPATLPIGCFRTYDIRGTTGEEGISNNLAYAIGLALGTEAQLCGVTQVIVGRDGRLTGAELHRAMCVGLMQTGCDVLDIGQVPSPVVYFATHVLSSNTGVMITASHNPRDDNGFKIVLNGKTLSTAGVQQILQRIQRQDFRHGQGALIATEIRQAYFAAVTRRITLAKPLRVVVDCGNGVAGVWVPELYRALGCEVDELFCQVDGNFPNHHPDPTIPENLTALIARVQAVAADIGLAFDGDADRLGVVTNTGEIIWPDRQLMLFARDLLTRLPGSDIVFDVKCSNNLAKVIQQHGGNPIMYRTGHSVLKSKMLEIDAPLAGEMSGHIFLRENWYGFDDGLYVGACLLRILSGFAGTSSALFATLPDSVNTPELKLPMPDADKAFFMQRLLDEADFGAREVLTIDGLRIDYGYGWGLVRPSNTSPYLTMRFEADSEQQLQAIQQIFRRELLKLDSTLALPF